MATYKGIGYDSATGRNRTGTSSDDISFDALVTATDGVSVTGVGVTVTTGGINVQGGGATIVGNSSITGNLTVTGTLISQDEEQILVKDNFLDLNFGYVGTSYEQTGLTFNYQATSSGVSINASSNSVQFTAGTTTARAKVVASQVSDIPADTFADGDIVQINGTTNADNDGIYVVNSNSGAGTVDFKSSTLTTPDTVNAKFALLNVTTETESTATALTIRKVNLMALRSSNAGALQSATGAVDASFATYSAVGSDTALQQAYDAGNTITTDASGAITFTLSADNQGLSVQGGSGGTGEVSIGGTTAIDSFVVGASGAASSITSTGQNLTLQTATSGVVTLRSAGTMTVDSDDNMAITLDADANSAKTITIQANNTNAGGSKEANIVLDADDNVDTQIAGTKIWGVDSGGGVIYAGNALGLANTGNTAQYIVLTGSDGSIAFDQAAGTPNVISKAAAATDDDLQIKVTGNQDAHLLISSEGTSANALKLETVTNGGGIELNSVNQLNLFSDDRMIIQMDADDAANKQIGLTANNTGSGEGNIALDADNNIELKIAATNVATLTSTGFALAAGSRVNDINDEDDMVSDSNTALATQQSIKAYVDSVGVSGFAKVVTMVVNEAIAAGDVIAIKVTGGDEGRAIKADADAIATCNVIGIAIEAQGSVGSNVRVAQAGSLTGFSGLSAGEKQFASLTAGSLTADVSGFSAGDVIFQVGYAISSTQIIIAPAFVMELG